MAAIADKIMNETLPKSKLEQFYDSYNDLLYKRKKAYEAIRRMPASAAKQDAIREFNDVEGVVTSVVFPAVNKIFSLIGYKEPDSSLPNNGTFGFLPAIWTAYVGASYATQTIIAAAIATSISYIAASTLRYGTILARPEVAKYDQGGFFPSLGAGAEKAITIIAVAAAVGILFYAYRKAPKVRSTQLAYGG